MKRFNYAITPAERLFGFSLPTAIAPRLRAPLAAVTAAFALTATTGGIEEVRFHAADRAAAESHARLAAAEIPIAQVQAVRNDVVRLRALAAHLEQARLSGTARANEIAALGNALPPDAWLTAVHVERRTLGLEGRAARVATVATAMAALGRLPAYAGARLLNVRDDAARAGVTYAITLDTTR
jgi:hypothetical protein